MDENKAMEDQMNGNVPAMGTTKKGNFLSIRWAMITATAIIAIVVGFLLGHCCHRRHCCGDRCEMGGRGMMMHRGWGGGMGYGHFGRGGMDRGDMRGEGMRGGPMGGMHHGIDADARAEHMKEELGLTDQQAAQIKAIYEQNRAKLEAAMNNSDTSKRHVDWKANAEEVMAQEKAVLTPEQQAKWQKMRDDRMEHGE